MNIHILSEGEHKHNNNNKAVCPKSAFFFASPLRMDLSEQPVSGAAQRRRQRRLRSWLRHERMTVAMALAERTHHFSRGQTIVRAGEREHELNYTATIRDPPTHQPELFSLFEEESGGARPACLVAPRGLRHVVEHRCPFVQILDAPVPQGGNQLVEAFRHLDLRIPEQVVEVPKISSSRRRCRRRRVPVVQTAEQLVEVPEFVSFAFLFQQQMADASGGPQGFLTGQDYLWEVSRSWTLQFLMVVVGLIREVFKVLSQYINSAAVAEQIVDIPARRGLSDFLPGQSSTASSSSRLLDDADEGIPVGKKVRSWVRTRGRN